MMTGGEPASRDKALIEKEAVAWFTRLNGKPSGREERDFRTWIKASTQHEQAFEAVRTLWSALGPVADIVGRRPDDNLAEPLEKIRKLREGHRVNKAGAAVVVGLATLLVGSWVWLEHPHILEDLEADYVTARAERRSIALSDGSEVLMDADTALEVEMTGSERRVHLLRGTAYFRVNRADVPFIVEAENGEARVLGTEFDVALGGEREVTITLASGSLEVSLLNKQQETVLKPGESVDYGRTGLGEIRSVSIDESTAWHSGRLIFTNARLGDVLAKIGRYRSGRIVVLGSSVGETRVSGNISLENTDAALAAVQSSVGFRMTAIGGMVTVIGP